MAQRTPVTDGVEKEVVKPGNGTPLQPGQNITVHCTGSLQGPPVTKFWR